MPRNTATKPDSKQAQSKGKSAARQRAYRQRLKNGMKDKEKNNNSPTPKIESGIKTERIWEMERTSILQKAMDVVGPANRGADYGHPLDNFEMEAELMNVWMKFKHKLNVPGEVAHMDSAKPGEMNEFFDWKDMAVHKIFMKLTRECHRHKEDNSVDLAGYAWTLEEAFIEDKKRRGVKP